VLALPILDVDALAIARARWLRPGQGIVVIAEAAQSRRAAQGQVDDALAWESARQNRVFRKSVTDGFGNVTGHFGDVTDGQSSVS
jgi:hypothetical protein